MQTVQEFIDSLTANPNADVGFFHRDDGSVVYTVSIRILSGALRYGTSDVSIEAAFANAMSREPIRPALQAA